jgi:vacuolar-type H+-ATPase subunit E/Vma4
MSNESKTDIALVAKFLEESENIVKEVQEALEGIESPEEYAPATQHFLAAIAQLLVEQTRIIALMAKLQAQAKDQLEVITDIVTSVDQSTKRKY